MKYFLHKHKTKVGLAALVTIFAPRIAHAAWWDLGLSWIVVKLLDITFRIVGWIVSKLATIMDWTVRHFILKMPQMINSLDAINSLWRILRDVGNMVFIFLILYAAVSITLDINKSSAKEILRNVVIVALFVNFSLFATQVVVDTSNVLALQIYDNISVAGNSGANVNLSNAMADLLNLSSLQSAKAISIANETATNFELALSRLFGTVAIGFAGFVMGAFALMVSLRFLVLILLMIASPIAFISFTLPSIDIGKEWWDKLVSYSFFAPAMMLMLYITLRTGKSMKESSMFQGSGDLTEAFVKEGSSVDILVFYGLIIGLLFASLYIAKQMGVAGGKKAVSYAESAGDWARAKVTGSAAYVGGSAAGAAGWAGRTSLGRLGRNVADREDLKETEAEGGVYGYLAQQTRRAGEAIAGKSFDVRNTQAVDSTAGAGYREGGYDEMIEDQREFRRERMESLGELSPEEEERVAKAKLKKEQMQESVEEEKERIEEEMDRIDDQKSAVEDNLQRDKEPIQEEIESLKNTLQERESDYKENKDEIESQINSVEKAIDKRDELKQKAAEAIDNGNDEQLRIIRQQQEELVNQTDGVQRLDDLNNLEAERDNLQQDREQLKNTFNAHKSRLESEIESREDDIKDLEEQAEQRKEALDNRKARLSQQIDRLEDNLERREEQLDEVINMAENREEEYIQAMMEQHGAVDGLISRARERMGATEPRAELTIPTQANREMAVSEIDKVEDEDVREEISQQLRA